MLEINYYTFLLTAADQYVFDFMERPEMVEQFKHSNIRVILAKIVSSVGHLFKQIMARYKINKSEPN